MMILTITSVFLFVALMTGGIIYVVMSRRSVVQARLEKMMPHNTPQDVKATLVREKTPFQAFLDRIGQYVKPSQRDTTTYASYLVAAGFRKEALPIFMGCKLMLTLLLPAMLILFYALPMGAVLNPQVLLYTLILAIVGFLAPSLWLQQRVRNRKSEIFHTLPDILDLLTVCVEAGIGIDAALIKTSENPQFRGNPLAEELKIAGMEARAGKQRSEALKDMANRTMVDDLKSFVTMLTQSERFGTSLSLALRVHSDSLRTKRRQMAEEAAAKTSVKMLFPLVIFVFPALMVIMIGPAVLLFKDVFK